MWPLADHDLDPRMLTLFAALLKDIVDRLCDKAPENVILSCQEVDLRRWANHGMGSCQFHLLSPVH